MARAFSGHEAIDAAFEAASTVEQLRQAQAVVLPLRYGLSLEQTAEAIGISKSWACRLRNDFIGGKVLDARGSAARGGRRGSPDVYFTIGIAVSHLGGVSPEDFERASA